VYFSFLSFLPFLRYGIQYIYATKEKPLGWQCMREVAEMVTDEDDRLVAVVGLPLLRGFVQVGAG
jgi:hypothetical protein